LESAYTYVGTNTTCVVKPKVATPKITEVGQYFLNGNETQLKNIVATVGPTAVAMYASSAFMNYKSGIFQDTDCPSTCINATTKAWNVNHAMVVVGYGTNATANTDFWIVRNSWGTAWGEAGYVRTVRNKANNCNYACWPMFVI